MSQRPIAHSPAVQRLTADGYEIEIQHQHLLVHSIPYVTPKREIQTGILACAYTESDGMDSKPPDHTVWFKGEMPCTAQGTPLAHLVNHSNAQTLFEHFIAQHYLSNKPVGVPDFPSDYYTKVVHYVDILTAQAKVIDPDVDARTGRVIASQAHDSIFRYPDSASARAGIVAASQKLSMSRIAIVGLGGTGSYILDQVAKTSVKEIHLFDEKDFKRHNAFRSPGAASLDTLSRNLKKVGYYSEMYDAMRSGIYAHPFNLDKVNVNALARFDFVFICVDDGPSRGIIASYLCDQKIPFVDVGMGLEKSEDTTSLIGLCRVSVGTPAKYDHLKKRLPVTDDRADALYQSNIQVADMNAMNAILAVMKWKQYCGFYIDHEGAHHLSFSVAMQSIAREDAVAG